MPGQKLKPNGLTSTLIRQLHLVPPPPNLKFQRLLHQVPLMLMSLQTLLGQSSLSSLPKAPSDEPGSTEGDNDPTLSSPLPVTEADEPGTEPGQITITGQNEEVVSKPPGTPSSEPHPLQQEAHTQLAWFSVAALHAKRCWVDFYHRLNVDTATLITTFEGMLQIAREKREATLSSFTAEQSESAPATAENTINGNAANEPGEAVVTPELVTGQPRLLPSDPEALAPINQPDPLPPTASGENDNPEHAVYEPGKAALSSEHTADSAPGGAFLIAEPSSATPTADPLPHTLNDPDRNSATAVTLLDPKVIYALDCQTMQLQSKNAHLQAHFQNVLSQLLKVVVSIPQPTYSDKVTNPDPGSTALKEELADAQENARSKADEIKRLEDQLTEKADEISRLSQEVQKSKGEVDRVAGQLSLLDEQLQKSRSEMEVIQSNIEPLQRVTESLEGSAKQLEQDKLQAKDDNKKTQEEHDRLQAELQSVLQELKEKESEKEKLERSIQNAKRELKSTNQSRKNLDIKKQKAGYKKQKAGRTAFHYNERISSS